jgi:hypothetical protein
VTIHPDQACRARIADRKGFLGDRFEVLPAARLRQHS